MIDSSAALELAHEARNDSLGSISRFEELENHRFLPAGLSRDEGFGRPAFSQLSLNLVVKGTDHKGNR
jgi:hypothetical protein